MIERNQKLARTIAATLARNYLPGSLALLAPLPVLAQDAPNCSRTIEGIAVTAQRREQVLQEAPITPAGRRTTTCSNDVTAEDMGDLNGYVPGLVVSSNSPTQPRYQIRGIQTGDFAVATDFAVGVYIDGIDPARSGSSLLAFNHVERIEVLKGSQGTLFDRNSAAGAVRSLRASPPTNSTRRAAARRRI